MANPQKENGFAPISKELLRALAQARLSPAEWACVCCVIDATYGWRRTRAPISHTSFCSYTGYSTGTVRTALRSLRKRHILEANHRRRPVLWKIQKDYDRWTANGSDLRHLSVNTSDHISVNTSVPHYKQSKESTVLRTAGVTANQIVENVMEIGLHGTRPPDWAKQHKAAARLVELGATADLARAACERLRQRFPWDDGRPFDVFDLERHWSKLIAEQPAEVQHVCGDKFLGCGGQFPESQMVRSELAWWCRRCAHKHDVRAGQRSASRTDRLDRVNVALPELRH